MVDHNVVTHTDARESYLKQRSYTKQIFSHQNRTFIKLDLFRNERMPRYVGNDLNLRHIFFSKKSLFFA